MSIFVGNLPFRAEQADVAELFAPFGDVVTCALPLERDTGRKRGFAFVEMADPEMEIRAIEALQGVELMGRPLRINRAEPRSSAPRRTAGPGRGSAAGGPGFAGSSERGSGARGWEDRSYGAERGDGETDFDAGRTRRRRSGSGGGSGYGSGPDAGFSTGSQD